MCDLILSLMGVLDHLNHSIVCSDLNDDTNDASC